MNERARAASKSLNKTITEILTSMGTADARVRPRKGLRKFLRKLLADFGVATFRRGANRAHKELLAIFRRTGKVPRVLKWEGKRTLFVNEPRIIRLKSRVQPAGIRRRRARRARTAGT